MGNDEASTPPPSDDDLAPYEWSGGRSSAATPSSGEGPVDWAAANTNTSSSTPPYRDTATSPSGTPDAETTAPVAPVVADAQAPNPGSSNGKRRKRLVPLLLLAGVVAVVVVAILLTRNNDNTTTKVAASHKPAKQSKDHSGTRTQSVTTSTTSAATTTTGTGTPNGSSANGGGTGTGTGSGAGTGGGTGTGGGGTPPISQAVATTPPAPPKPVITSASATPGAFYCTGPNESYNVTVSWSAKNATYVTLSDPAYSGQQQPVSSSVTISDGCAVNSMTITAHGPGGTASTTVSWRYLSSPPT